MATSIFFNGRVISTPGSYSQVDSSALDQVGLGAAGIVAVLGTAEGGMPAGVMTDPSQYLRVASPAKATGMFRTGDLLEVMNFLFAGSKDPNISGAQQVVAMKVNPATQSVASFANALGNAIDVTSLDYGAFTSQIHISIANGSSQGKLVSTIFENTIESADNLGGSPLFNLSYNGDYTTMVAGVEADGSIHALATYAKPGMSTDLTAQVGTASVLTVTATAGDAGKQVVVYGLVGGVATRETITLVNGSATSVNTYTKIFGAFVSAAAAGTITVLAGGTTLVTFAATNINKGVVRPNYAYVSGGTITLVAGGASTAQVFIAGKNAAGSNQHEVLTLNGTTPVTSVGNYTSIYALGLFDVGTGVTVTASATAARSSALVQTTLRRTADFFNSLQSVIGPTTYGFNFALATTSTAQSVSIFDKTVADVSIASPANPAFYGDLYAIINWINSNSQLITAAKSAGAIGPPSPTASPVFLSGGSEGTPTFANWQAALNQLKQVRVNSVVVLSCDPAIAAALDAHCAYMCGIGRSERDGFVGLQNPGLTDVPSLTSAISQVQALNTRNLRCVAQAVTRFDSTGTKREFQPQFAAALAAGMQAGASVGTSLTHKYVSALSFRQASTWNPTDNAEQLINAGLLFLEQIDGVGVRWVRNVTAWLQDNKISNVEGSVNAAVNYAVYTFRTNLEFAVGRQGFSGTVNATKGAAIGTLGLLTGNNILTNWQKLSITLNIDVMEVSVDIAPVIPINFVKSTIHLVTSPIGNPKAA